MIFKLKSMNIHIIVAFCKNRGIGLHNTIPWNIPSDLKYFKYITSQTENLDKVNAVIMGRNTWQSISENPLKGRINVVISTTLDKNIKKNVHIIESFEKAVDYINENYKDTVENIFAIGGENIYRSALNHPNLSKIYITEIINNYECDRFFPYVDENNFTKKLSNDMYVENENVHFRYILLKK